MNIKALETCEMFYNYENKKENSINENVIFENENDILLKEAVAQTVRSFEELVRSFEYMIHSLLNTEIIERFKQYALGKLFL